MSSLGKPGANGFPGYAYTKPTANEGDVVQSTASHTSLPPLSLGTPPPSPALTSLPSNIAEHSPTCLQMKMICQSTVPQLLIGLHGPTECSTCHWRTKMTAQARRTLVAGQDAQYHRDATEPAIPFLCPVQ